MTKSRAVRAPKRATRAPAAVASSKRGQPDRAKLPQKPASAKADIDRRRIEKQADFAQLTDVDLERGRVGPSALDGFRPFVGMVLGATNGDRNLARFVLRRIAEMLEVRRVIPEPFSSYLAQALFEIADATKSADQALHLVSGKKQRRDHYVRNQRIYEHVEELYANRGPPLESRSAKRGVYDIVSAELREQGIKGIGAKMVGEIHREMRKLNAALAARANGSHTPGQRELIKRYFPEID